MWIHLNPVGGVAGDMFIASLLNAFPELENDMLSMLKKAGTPAEMSIEVRPYQNHSIGGAKFSVKEIGLDKDRNKTPGNFIDILKFIESTPIDKKVKLIAKEIFSFVAEAESAVHRIEIDSISFHELGEWDSIIDILGASFLINQLNAVWSFDPLPLGSGLVSTQHGKLPVPAPATSFLLKGFQVFDDGVAGERVTPTGAAILKYLKNFCIVPKREGTLYKSGVGFGNQKFSELPNILRVLIFTTENVSNKNIEKIAKLEFEVDDQSPEHLSIAVGRLREISGVLDLIQSSVSGKKGRMTTSIQIVSEIDKIDLVINKCFLETTTIGIRYQIMERVILERTIEKVDYNGNEFRVKIVNRQGFISGKVEADDLLRLPGGHHARAIEGGKAEAIALEKNSLTKK